MSKLDLEHNPQKFKWNKVATYKNYDAANEKRDELDTSGKVTKIRRCGDNGALYKVLVGESLEKKQSTKKATPEKKSTPKTRASRRAEKMKRKNKRK